MPTTALRVQTTRLPTHLTAVAVLACHAPRSPGHRRCAAASPVTPVHPKRDQACQIAARCGRVGRERADGASAFVLPSGLGCPGSRGVSGLVCCYRGGDCVDQQVCIVTEFRERGDFVPAGVEPSGGLPAVFPGFPNDSAEVLSGDLPQTWPASHQVCRECEAHPRHQIVAVAEVVAGHCGQARHEDRVCELLRRISRIRRTCGASSPLRASGSQSSGAGSTMRHTARARLRSSAASWLSSSCRSQFDNSVTLGRGARSAEAACTRAIRRLAGTAP